MQFSLFGQTYAQDLKNKCMLASEDSTKDEYLRLVRKMEFEKAKEFCDQLPKDLNNCKASSRFWLGVTSYADGDFSKAEFFFKEGLEFKKKFGHPKHWIRSKDSQTGWGNPEDMLLNTQKSAALVNKDFSYIQAVTYLIIDNTDTSENQNNKKIVQMKMDPCLALHGLLSLRVLKRYIELFSNAQLSIQIKTIPLSQTATQLNQKNYIMLGSLKPWDVSLSLMMNQISSESDLVFVAYPRFGGNANANYGNIPIIPKIANSPVRTYIKMPSQWLTMINFPQIFHEYMHTVEFLMKRNGDAQFHATSHGSDGKKVEAITGLPTKTTGETDWAEHLFANRIQDKVNKIESNENKNGWEQIFGIHVIAPNKLTDDNVKEKFKEFSSNLITEDYLPNTEDSN